VSVESLVYEKGNCERFVLGSVLLNDGLFAEVAAMLPTEAFSLEKRRRIFARMTDLAKRDERMSGSTGLRWPNELIVQGQIESIDGMGYLVSLDEGIPELPNIESYIRIIREKYDKRRAIFACQRAVTALLEEEDADAVISSLDKNLLDTRAGGDLGIWSPLSRRLRFNARLKQRRVGWGSNPRHLPSGAGHDAQMMATLMPMGMIFVPSIGGISHSPNELTSWQDCANGANVLLETVMDLAK
jgi:hypothetical protein